MLEQIKFEKHPWKSRFSRQDLSRSKQEYLINEYYAAVPNKIFNLDFDLPRDLLVEVEDVANHIARFDESLKNKKYDIPAIMLRSESASSSQIEQLTASSKNIALAQIEETSPSNSKVIAANITAMQNALTISEPLSIDIIRRIHKSLLESTADDIAGKLRDEQVWIGGTTISPHKAAFVPPHHSKIKEYLNDLVKFSNRSDLNTLVIAAVAHAQFETIHPFIDGNGRTGRALLQKTLKDNGILQNTALPVSLGLLSRIEDYYLALAAYQKGDYLQIISAFTDSAFFAVSISKKLVECIDKILATWENNVKARKDSNIWKLIELLVRNPVVDANFIESKLNITEKSAYNVIYAAQKFGIISKIGKKGGSEKFGAKDIIQVIDDVMSGKGVFRRLGGV